MRLNATFGVRIGLVHRGRSRCIKYLSFGLMRTARRTREGESPRARRRHHPMRPSKTMGIHASAVHSEFAVNDDDSLRLAYFYNRDALCAIGRLG